MPSRTPQNVVKNPPRELKTRVKIDTLTPPGTSIKSLQEPTHGPRQETTRKTQFYKCNFSIKLYKFISLFQ